MVVAATASSFAAAKGYSKKSEASELTVTGWSCFFSFAAFVVIGSITLIYAISHYGGMHEPGFKEAAAIRTELPTTVASRLGFFLEIGQPSINVEESARGRHLERKGWNGVCAVPFPGHFSGRTCKVVALAVGGLSGEKVLARDCTKDRLSLSMFSAEEDPCPPVETNTLGIADLMSVSAPPATIDYISLDTNGKEADIISNFPFQKHCVRAWAVRHNHDSVIQSRVQQELEVAQGCRMHDAKGEIWARCPCGKVTDKQKVTQSSAASAVRRQDQTSMVLDENGHASEPMKN